MSKSAASNSNKKPASKTKKIVQADDPEVLFLRSTSSTTPNKKRTKLDEFLTPSQVMESFQDENPLPDKALQSRERVTRPLNLGESPKAHFSKNEVPNPKLADERVKENPGEYLKHEPLGRIHCMCCHQSISWKSTTFKLHLTSAKHVRNKEMKERSKEKEGVLRKHLRDSVAVNGRRSGDTLDEENNVQRLRLCRVAMIGGVKFTQLDDEISELGDLLRDVVGPFNVQDLRDKIPDVKAMEIASIKKDLQSSKAPIGIIFDGSTKVAEVLALIIRWFNEDTGRIEQRLISASMWARSFSGAELARVLLEKLLVEFSISPERIHVACRDGCSVNTTAVDMLRPLFPRMFDMHCFAHAANNAGLLFDIPIATLFLSKWSEMMSSSTLARSLFRQAVGKKTQRKSKVRWFTEHMVARQLFQNPQAVRGLLNSPLDFSPKLRPALLLMLEGPDSAQLYMELALLTKVGEHVCDFIYQYEGDVFLADKMYGAQELLITQLRAVAENHICPALTDAAVAAHPNDEESRVAAFHATCEKARPVLNKFLSYFGMDHMGRLRDAATGFRAFSILNPFQFRQKGIAASVPLVDLICQFPAIAALNVRNTLIEELGPYLVHATDVPLDVDVLRWWFDHKQHMPTWYHIVIPEAVIFQPTSCAAERVFAMITWMFDDNQTVALEDYKEYSLIARYNAAARRRL